jgi:hypothetical protein
MDRSGLGGGLSGTGSGGTKSGSGLKAPSVAEDQKDHITELVRELDALVKTKRVPHGSVAVMDSHELRAHISQIDLVVTELNAKTKSFSNLLIELYGTRDLVGAVRDNLVTNEQATHINAHLGGLFVDWNYAIALQARLMEKEAAKAAAAKAGPVKGAGVPSAHIHTTGPPSGLLWIGGGETDANRKNHGDFIAGNQQGATIEGDWKTDEFWKRVEESGAKYFAIDEGSDSWLYSTKPNQTDYAAAFKKLVGAVYGARARNGVTSTLLFSVPDEIRDDNLWVPALINALIDRNVHSDNVWLQPCKGGGSNSVIVQVTIGTNPTSSTGGKPLTYEWIQTRIQGFLGKPLLDSSGNRNRLYERTEHSTKTYDEIVRDHVTLSSSRQASSQVAQQLAAYTDRHASEYVAAAVKSADGKLAPILHLPQAAAVTKTVGAFNDNDEVTFKYKLCKLGGKVISYDYSKDTYTIEWIKTNPVRTKFRFTSVSSKNVSTRTPEFSNSAKDQVFSKDRLIWFHRGHDSFQGKVKEYQASKSDPGKQLYIYSIVYEDEKGYENHDEHVPQIYLERM